MIIWLASVAVLAQVWLKLKNVPDSAPPSRLRVHAMTLDSPAAFANRIVEIGFSEDHSARFKVAGWNTLAHLAFSTPQGGTEEAFIRDIVVAGLGTPDHVDKAKLRRLYFEAFMLASDDLRRRANPVPGTTGREMGAAEREERGRGLVVAERGDPVQKPLTRFARGSHGELVNVAFQARQIGGRGAGVAEYVLVLLLRLERQEEQRE